MSNQFSVGTHNTLDETGIPTGFADLIGFTEAIPSRVKANLKDEGYKFVSVWRQPDLVIAYKPEVFKKVGIAHYKRVVDGRKHVTPNRGTLKVRLEVLATGELVDVFLEHRINAAFPPYKRSKGDPEETKFRIASWQAHTTITVEWMQRSIRRGHKVIGFGDLNTPRGVSGYRGILTEVGSGYDRIGGSGFEFWHVAYLSHMKSDHPRLRAVAKSWGKTWTSVRYDEAA